MKSILRIPAGVACPLQSQGMLYYAIVALVAAALGFWVVTGVAMTIAKILCLVFVILAILSLFRGRSPRL